MAVQDGCPHLRIRRIAVNELLCSWEWSRARNLARFPTRCQSGSRAVRETSTARSQYGLHLPHLRGHLIANYIASTTEGSRPLRDSCALPASLARDASQRFNKTPDPAAVRRPRLGALSSTALALVCSPALQCDCYLSSLVEDCPHAKRPTCIESNSLQQKR